MAYTPMAPTTPRPESLHGLPKSARDYTPEQREDCVKWLSSLSLAVLRKRQNVIASQMRMAVDQQKPDALADLQEMYDIETDAVDLREFGT